MSATSIACPSCRDGGRGRCSGRTSSSSCACGSRASGTPQGVTRVAARRVVRLAAAVRVVHRVHRHAARLRALAAVARAARLAQLDQLVLGVAEHADRGAAVHQHHPHLARGQPQRRVACPPSPPAGSTCRRERPSWPPRPGVELHVVDGRTGRDVRERQASSPARCPRPGRTTPSSPTADPRRARGCSASRRPRSGAARCAPSGSGRTRSRRPSPARRPCVRLKSILRYLRLAPPPRWREVTRPWALRPPDFVSPSVSDFSGSFPS